MINVVEAVARGGEFVPVWLLGTASAIIAAVGVTVSWMLARSVYKQTAERDLRDRLAEANRRETELKMHLAWVEGQNIELMRRLLQMNGGVTEGDMIARAREEWELRKRAAERGLLGEVPEE